MPQTAARPILATASARALLAHVCDDQLLHAGLSLLILAGLRRGEVEELSVDDYTPGPDPVLRVGGPKRPRTIRVAASAGRAVDTYLAGQDSAPGEPLLVGLQGQMFGRLVARAARELDIDVGVYDLRRTAMAVVLEDGTPVSHVEAYFGLSPAPGRKMLVGVPDGYDVGIAAVLETAFGA